jgi:hypothetical protein
VKHPPRRLPGRCAYCGAKSRTLTCPSHRDLPALDPHYAAGEPPRTVRGVRGVRDTQPLTLAA